MHQDHSPIAVVVSRDLFVANRLQSLLADGGIRSIITRDSNEARTTLDDASTKRMEVDLIIIDTDVVADDRRISDVTLVGEIRRAPKDMTVGSARRLRHLPIIVVSDDLTSHTSDEVRAIDSAIPVLERSNLGRFTLLAAIQRRLGAYRHQLLESVQRIGLGFVFENGRFTIAAPSLWHGSHDLVRTTHVLADRQVVSAAYNRLLLVTDRWKWGDLVLNQFEALLNDTRAAESDYQQFFEVNPSFVMRNDFDNYWAEPVLRISRSSKYYKPDFVLGPRNPRALTEWGLVDLKRPNVPLLEGKSFHKDLSKHVYNVQTQLRDYAEDFADSANADTLRKKFGVAPRPRRLVAIIGRRPTHHLPRYLELVNRVPDVQIRTYDDVLEFERAKVDLIKKASSPASDEIVVPRLTLAEGLDNENWEPFSHRRYS